MLIRFLFNQVSVEVPSTGFMFSNLLYLPISQGDSQLVLYRSKPIKKQTAERSKNLLVIILRKLKSLCFTKVFESFFQFKYLMCPVSLDNTQILNFFQISYLLEEVKAANKKSKSLEKFLHTLNDFFTNLESSERHDVSELVFFYMLLRSQIM